jgi:ATP-dependent DNA helicase RecG
MSINVENVSADQADRVTLTEEGQFSDVKRIEISPAKLTKTVSAFANSDGGDLYVGIQEVGPQKTRKWDGFKDQEAANGHLQIFEKLFPLGTDFQYEFLRCEGLKGLVLHVQINKTQAIMLASNGIPHIRRGAQSLPVDPGEMMKRLEYCKGISSFETETTTVPEEVVTGSRVVNVFMQEVVPTAKPAQWLRKQVLIREGRPTVAGVLLFADEPQALLPKRCGIKVYRYKTRETEGFREALAFNPETVEGCLYDQIKSGLLPVLWST